MRKVFAFAAGTLFGAALSRTSAEAPQWALVGIAGLVLLVLAALWVDAPQPRKPPVMPL